MTDGRIGMVKGLRRSLLIIKAVRELGLQKLFLFAVYRLGMLSGYYRWRSRERTGDHKTKSAEEYASSGGLYKKVFPLPDPKVVKDVIGSAGVEQLIKEADEIVSGNVRLFGGELVPLNLTVPGSIKHWTKHLGGQEIVDSVSGSKDIKFICIYVLIDGDCDQTATDQLLTQFLGCQYSLIHQHTTTCGVCQ